MYHIIKIIQSYPVSNWRKFVSILFPVSSPNKYVKWALTHGFFLVDLNEGLLMIKS